MSLKHENKFEFARIFTALWILNTFTNLELLRCESKFRPALLLQSSGKQIQVTAGVILHMDNSKHLVSSIYQEN